MMGDFDSDLNFLVILTIFYLFPKKYICWKAKFVKSTIHFKDG